jgi:hypothetical protein
MLKLSVHLVDLTWRNGMSAANTLYNYLLSVHFWSIAEVSPNVKIVLIRASALPESSKQQAGHGQSMAL